ncbi:MAG: amidohydrolase family protein [Terricaulis sp.]
MLHRTLAFAGALGALAVLVTSSLAQTPAAPAVAKIIHAGRLLADPATGRVLTQQSILVGADGKIIGIEAGYVTRDGAQIIDETNRFVLPGFADCHVHLTSELGPNQLIEGVTQTASDQALFGAYNARLTVQAGFTTVADLGAEPDSIFALRDAINHNWVPGPRIIAAGAIITPTGGHGDVNGYSPEVNHTLASVGECNGADDCRRAVRAMVQRGANIIKFVATGGVLSNTAAGVGQQFTQDEMNAIVETAHALGRKAVAHAHGANGINAALRAGVDAIEHGSYLDDESVRLFRHMPHTYLVPTLEAGWWVGQLAERGGTLTPAQTDKARIVSQAIAAMIQRAHHANVPIAFGTDTGVSPHGQNAKEFELLVQEGGYTPLQAIQFATVAAADHLGLTGTIGRIAPGYSADIVAIDGDPTADVTVLMNHVSFVMARGTIARAD